MKLKIECVPYSERYIEYNPPLKITQHDSLTINLTEDYYHSRGRMTNGFKRKLSVFYEHTSPEPLTGNYLRVVCGQNDVAFELLDELPQLNWPKRRLSPAIFDEEHYTNKR